MARAIRSVIVIFLTAVWAATALADVKTFDELERRQGAVGSYKALVIGIDTYADSVIEGSPAAVTGARHVAEALKGRAGFDVKLLINEEAGRASVMREFRGLARGMGINDSVLIYFSGSSHTDKASRKAWWLPSDARSDDAATWIADHEIQDAVNAMKARDVLILSDAALGDTMFGATHRLASRRDGEYYVGLFNKRSRWAMISGNTLPVADEGGISVFARGVATALSSKGPCLTTMEMFSGMKKELRASGVLPPRCRSIRNTGDQGGEFVFLLAAPAAPAPVVVKAPRVVKPKPAPVAVVKLVPPKPKRTPPEGRLKVSANINGAELYIDGKKQGTTPVGDITLKPGTHEVSLSKEGYLAWNGTVDIQRGKARSLNATLTKEPPKKGRLFIKVRPKGASVQVDGASFKSGAAISAGTHTVKVSAPLFKTGKAKAVVSSGKDAWVEVFLTPRDEFKGEWGRFVYIEPGSFTMGSPDTEARRKADENAHAVTLTHGFFMQDKEVTLAQWQAFVDDSGYKSEAETAGGAFVLEDYIWTQSREYSWKNPGFPQGDDHPVTGLTCADIEAYLKWINGRSRNAYRLPTEAEWEYAARAGGTSAFSSGECLGSADANVDANASWGGCPAGAASSGTMPVGSFEPNAWGLYDMHGNVAEWCGDWYGRYPRKAVKNPKGAPSGTNRVVRGGGWATYAYNARCAKREASDPSRGCSEVGMRLVVEVPK